MSFAATDYPSGALTGSGAPEIIRFSYDRLGQMLTEETVQKFKIIHLT
ncbi:hypothetical protein [Escherichia coli]